MSFLVRWIIFICANAAVLYIASAYFSELGFSLQVSPFFLGLVVVGFVFWVFQFLIRRIVQVIALPFKFLTLGLSTLIINVIILYVFSYVVNNYIALNNISISVSLGDPWQTFLLSLALSLVLGITSFILKKIV